VPATFYSDETIFGVTPGFAAVTTLLFGTVPAWKTSRSDPGTLLKSRTTMGGGRQVTGRMFVPIQVGLSLVLVVMASLLSYSLMKLRGARAGFDLDHVTTQTALFDVPKLKGDARLDLYQRMVNRLMQMPGVDSAAVTYQTPMTGIKITGDFQAVGEGSNPPEETQTNDKDLGNLVFLVHSQRKAQAVSAFRQALSEIAPTVPVMIFVTMREQMDAALGSQELITLLANFFGVVALLLSALGLSTDCYRRA
jgi:hypothetical protein